MNLKGFHPMFSQCSFVLINAGFSKLSAGGASDLVYENKTPDRSWNRTGRRIRRTRPGGRVGEHFIRRARGLSSARGGRGAAPRAGRGLRSCGGPPRAGCGLSAGAAAVRATGRVSAAAL
jgi:hypothetical protein